MLSGLCSQQLLKRESHEYHRNTAIPVSQESPVATNNRPLFFTNPNPLQKQAAMNHISQDGQKQRTTAQNIHPNLTRNGVLISVCERRHADETRKERIAAKRAELLRLQVGGND